MPAEKLQKPALTTNVDDLPIEVLDPLHSAQYYSVKMYAPDPDLAPFVDHYWIMRWDLPAGKSFTAEIIPSPYINLTFMPGGSKITGVTTGKYSYVVEGSGTIVGAKFLPGGYYLCSHNSASDVTDNVIPAVDIFELATNDSNAQALTAKTDKSALDILQTVISAKNPKTDNAIHLIGDIISDIKYGKCTTVLSVSKKYKISERRLQEIFHTYVGVGIKWIILRYRLLNATQLAIRPSVESWTTIAIELGYNDQSHFINDFKRIIGKTPKQYAKMSRK